MMMTCLKVYSNTNPPKEFHIKQGECERVLGGQEREINLLMKKNGCLSQYALFASER